MAFYIVTKQSQNVRIVTYVNNISLKVIVGRWYLCSYVAILCCVYGVISNTCSWLGKVIWFLRRVFYLAYSTFWVIFTLLILGTTGRKDP